LGNSDPSETESALTDLALQYQLVTDYTSMLVMSDSQFQEYGLERRNLARVNVENIAQQTRAQKSVTNYRVDQQKPTFGNGSKSPSFGGGGSISAWYAAFIAALLALLARRTFAV